MAVPTPLSDFVAAYAQSGTVRAHMPGHKGKAFLGCEALDITEIRGADALYEADGIIAQSEAIAARHFGAGRTLYSAEGSSQCIRAMLCLAAGLHRGPDRPLILAGRNVHKAFIHACALLDLDVRWLMPEGEGGGSVCSCPITPAGLEQALGGCAAAPCAVYITAPDYLGGSPDIAALAAVCRRHGLPLLVDNAHGAYLRFLTPSRHPLDLGAAMTCDSAHKTLPVLTGGAYLHISKAWLDRLPGDPRLAMGLFGSTSPSYLILQSLDLCNRYLETYGQRLADFVDALQGLRRRLTQKGWHLAQSDPLRLVVCGPGEGRELAQKLRQGGVECEYADPTAVVLMLTPENTPEDLARIETAFGLPEGGARRTVTLPALPLPRQVMSIRRAVLSPAESIPACRAVGRICAAPTVACPPAVPIAVSGEIITQAVADAFGSYGIDRVDVVREPDGRGE